MRRADPQLGRESGKQLEQSPYVEMSLVCWGQGSLLWLEHSGGGAGRRVGGTEGVWKDKEGVKSDRVL